MSVRVKILVSLVTLAVVTVVGFVFLSPKKAVADGIITIELCNYESVCTEEKHEFFTGDTVEKVLRRYYDVEIISSEMGNYISDIEGYVAAGGDSGAYLAIYVNDEASYVGIDDLTLHDEMKISFRYYVWVPE